MEAKAVLSRKSGVCAGYSNLFKAMCDLAKVECVCVGGWAKGYGYKPG